MDFEALIHTPGSLRCGARAGKHFNARNTL